jgi:hypothetical protein
VARKLNQTVHAQDLSVFQQVEQEGFFVKNTDNRVWVFLDLYLICRVLADCYTVLADTVANWLHYLVIEDRVELFDVGF